MPPEDKGSEGVFWLSQCLMTPQWPSKSSANTSNINSFLWAIKSSGCHYSHQKVVWLMFSNVFVGDRKTDQLTFQVCLHCTNLMDSFPDRCRRSKDFVNVANAQSTNFAANSVTVFGMCADFKRKRDVWQRNALQQKIRYADTLITLKSVSVSVGSVGRCEQGWWWWWWGGWRGAGILSEMGVWVSIHIADTFVHSQTCHWASGTF